MIPSKYIELLEDLLREYRTITEVEKMFIQYAQEDKLKVGGIELISRAIQAYSDWIINKIGLPDLVVLLRQIVLVTNAKIKVPQSLYNEIVKLQLDFGMYALELSQFVELSFDEHYPDWLKCGEEIKQIYEYRQPTNERVAGDSFLYAATGFKEYTSKAQKYILQATMKQEEGTTLLAVLRTGGGKSLTFQLPAYFESRGVTVVIVPTVALAIDQEKGVERLFANKPVKPKAIHSGVGIEERKQIEEELRNGSLPLVYVSPEVALGKWFKELLYELAENNLLNRFVIDEAHIVEEWGGFFRVEFQILAVLRRKLLALTQNKLKTILLSATVSEEVTELLKVLFSEEDNLITIRTDSLRKEILYYYSSCQTEEMRKVYLQTLLPLLPRPFIIYVGTREEASVYCELIKELKFHRVEVFTGETPTVQREKIIQKWRTNKLDIIVATSAFGVGVDKKDVRAVVHMYLPPSVDRYYQEVGRGGRDGNPALAISLIQHLQDQSLVNDLTKSKVLTTDRLAQRWYALRENALDQQGGDQLTVNVYTNPGDSEFTGELNANWNAYVLLFLARNHFIDILDAQRIDAQNYSFTIKLRCNQMIGSVEQITEAIQDARESERASVEEQMRKVKKMMTMKNKMCWGDYFIETYPHAEPSCRSCPVCRDKRKEAYFGKSYIEISEGHKRLKNYYETYYLSKNIFMEKETIYEVGPNSKREWDKTIKSYFKAINYMIVKDRKTIPYEWIKEYPNIECYEYAEIIEDRGQIVISGNILVWFEGSQYEMEHLFSHLQNIKLKYPDNHYLYIVPEDFSIRQKPFKAYVDGICIKKKEDIACED